MNSESRNLLEITSLNYIKLVDRTKTHIQIYMTLSPKDYCLIPGNLAIKFVETQKSPIINHFQIWFWQDTLQVHRLASNKMDISPDIDPTEILEF